MPGPARIKPLSQGGLARFHRATNAGNFKRKPAAKRAPALNSLTPQIPYWIDALGIQRRLTPSVADPGGLTYKRAGKTR